MAPLWFYTGSHFWQSKTVPVDAFVYINMHRKVVPDVGICPEICRNTK